MNFSIKQNVETQYKMININRKVKKQMGQNLMYGKSNKWVHTVWVNSNPAGVEINTSPLASGD